jgi:rfaE bifunctional protein nucleotidyltransferase chain/domain
MGNKIAARQEICVWRDKWRAENKVVGFTSGVFDLLHPGHVAYLTEARKRCDILVVGVNSDASVRALKGADRPVCPEKARREVVAGLEAVSYVFTFEELNNHENVNLLKPDIYLKAGDYTSDRLSSAALVEQYGGRVEIVPMLKGYSSSKTIDSIVGRYSACGSPSTRPDKPKPAIFVDRDGTLIEAVEYLSDPKKVKPLPGVFGALKTLRDQGYYLVMITNQPGIGLGYFTQEDFYLVNAAVLRLARAEGLYFDKIYYCPHSAAEKCSCRKPAPGMLERAVKDLNVDLKRSVVIGDMSFDVALGKNAGCSSILVQTGHAGKDGNYQAAPDFVAADMQAAVQWVRKSADL